MVQSRTTESNTYCTYYAKPRKHSNLALVPQPGALPNIKRGTHN